MALLQLNGINDDEIGLYTTERKLTEEEIQTIFWDCFEEAFVQTNGEEDILEVADNLLCEEEIFRVFCDIVTTNRL